MPKVEYFNRFYNRRININIRNIITNILGIVGYRQITTA